MSETTERRWGIIAATKGYNRAVIESSLPDRHRILASKLEPTESYDEYLIEGPDMPVVPDGSPPQRVEMVFFVDDSGIEYGSWEHLPQKRWLFSLQLFTA